MIIDIRGTNGAGKSQIVHNLLKECAVFEERLTRFADTDMYYTQIMEIGANKYNVALGRYKTQCGGCDGITNQQAITEAAEWFSKHDHPAVIIEGSIVGSVYTRWWNLAQRVGTSNYCFAFLDTPLELCIQRVRDRRAANGNLAPFDPDKTLVPRYKTIQKIMFRLIEAGAYVVKLNHIRALEEVKEVMRLGRVR